MISSAMQIKFDGANYGSLKKKWLKHSGLNCSVDTSGHDVKAT